MTLDKEKAQKMMPAVASLIESALKAVQEGIAPKSLFFVEQLEQLGEKWSTPLLRYKVEKQSVFVQFVNCPTMNVSLVKKDGTAAESVFPSTSGWVDIPQRCWVVAFRAGTATTSARYHQGALLELEADLFAEKLRTLVIGKVEFFQVAKVHAALFAEDESTSAGTLGAKVAEVLLAAKQAAASMPGAKL